MKQWFTRYIYKMDAPKWYALGWEYGGEFRQYQDEDAIIVAWYHERPPEEPK